MDHESRVAELTEQIMHTRTHDSMIITVHMFHINYGTSQPFPKCVVNMDSNIEISVDATPNSACWKAR